MVLPDNYTFDMSCVDLGLALQVAMAGTRRAAGWTEENGEFVVWWWAKPEANAFPSPLNAKQLQPIIEAWLAAQPEPKSIWRDATHEVGVRIYTGQWGFVGSNNYTLFAVQPVLKYYGK